MRALPAFFSAVGAASGRYGLQDGVVLQEGSQDSLEGGVDLGVQAPNAVGGLVDLACQVQVETSQHAQGCSVWSEWFFSDSGDMVFWWRDRMGLCRE